VHVVHGAVSKAGYSFLVYMLTDKPND